ncbi:LysM peptidoglycan-binding domain-containing protein [Demequina sp. SYSU T00192]|uniref:LysM peptidoglycan-binding domain-containing protein n=1 Tax=Demequina litoralis TaxID=3051660 RepID=A0ABT8G620_9MICO|nr:LysM peptidoglycan-binding domain-containing protein [Demequina sp. SYSU T00192]MDN4474586.1 LysM peptidoglycan-binding domain-containing protein [Demequina sp. SYSU T00192]
MAASTTPIPVGRAATTAALVTMIGLTTAGPAAADEQHRVREGETVSDLAHRYGSTIPAIVAANDLDARATIYVGTTVTIPTKNGTQATTRTTTTLSATYTVKAGDTLSEIAHRHGTTVAKLARANKLANAALIYPGQRLTIGGSGTSEQTSPASSGAATTSRSTYTVEAGDTLSEIAHRHGTTVAALARTNKLANAAFITVGQRLTIPGTTTTVAKKTTTTTKTTTSGRYTVEAGDTLSEIAHRHGTTVAALARTNKLANAAFITVGQRLTIPGTTTTVAKKTTTKKPASGTYTVKAGDTLSAIAQRHGTTVAALARTNSLANASTIYVGQRLTVPDGSQSSGGGTTSGLVGDTFAGRTYASDIVAAANRNKATLLARSVPSRDQMQALVVRTARAYGVDPALAQAISYQESGFDMRAVSPANAVGVMQVIPTSGEWASDMAGRRLDLLDPEDNVTAGILILRYLTRSFSKVDDAIAGYYQGAAAVRDHGYHSDTVGYVASVKALMSRFR